MSARLKTPDIVGHTNQWVIKMAEEKPLLLIDYREPPEMAVHVGRFFTLKTAELEVGDYADPSRRFVVERKSLDFLNLQHLFVQVEEIRLQPHPYLLVDTTYDALVHELAYRNMEKHLSDPLGKAKHTLSGVVASLSVRGVPPVFCGTKEDFAQILYKLYTKTFDGKDRTPEPKPIRPPPTRPLKTRHDWYIHILSSLPGVGEEKAETLIRHFKTPHALFNASVEEITAVEGFGPKTAHAILKAIGREE